MRKCATDIFTRKQGNCTQSVVRAWNEHQPEQAIPVDGLEKTGGGRAPGGLCGALHGARMAAGDKAEELTKAFAEATGHIRCREIRQQRKTSCADCVAIASSLLDQVQ